MGQRFQCFINVPNFSKQFYAEKKLDDKKEWKNNFRGYIELMNQKDYDDKAFGEKDNLILGFYHQWMYGRSAPLACLNILDFLDATSDNYDTNPFSPEYEKHYRGIAPTERAKIITSILSLFRDRELMPYTRSSGVEKFRLLNTEDKDEPTMTLDFTAFDNNDGIAIIDTITKKYCFMNISSQDKKSTSSSALPTLQPCSAMDYIEAYYPSTLTSGAKAHIKWLLGKENRGNKTDDQIQREVVKYEKELKENAFINKKFAKRFKKYEVLTLEEVAAMSPNMEDILVNHPELQEN
ncbi:MAG: hypothetical protein Q8O88_03600 [bacterium]|nr:hypothetical protein [bacterium]